MIQTIGNINNGCLNNVNTFSENRPIPNKENKGSRFLLNYSWVSLVAISVMTAINVFVLVRMYPRTSPVDFDYISLIIGILALLVTILIGWNIYSLVDFNKRREEIHRTSEKVRGLINKTNTSVTANEVAAECHFATIYNYLITKKSPIDISYFYIYHSIVAIMKCSHIQQYDMAELLCKNLLETIEPENLYIKRERKTDLYNLLDNVHNKTSIKLYDKVLVLIARIREK